MYLKSEMEVIQHNSNQAIIEYHRFKHFKRDYIYMYNKTGSVYINLSLRRVRVTILAEENQ